MGICDFYRTSGEIPEIDFNNPVSKLYSTETFYIENNIVATTAWGKLYKKSCFNSIRYPIGKIHEDEFVTYKILFKYTQIAYIATPLYMYCLNPTSIMSAEWSMRRLDALSALEEKIDFFNGLNNKKMFQYSKMQLKGKIASSNLHAFKVKKHAQLPQRYKWNFLKATNVLETIQGTDIYESIMWELYPNYVKLQSICRKIKEIILRRNLKKEGDLNIFVNQIKE